MILSLSKDLERKRAETQLKSKMAKLDAMIVDLRASLLKAEEPTKKA